MRPLRSALVIGFVAAMTQTMAEAQPVSTRVWSLGLSSNHTWDSNADLGARGDSQADLMSRVGINFGFSQASERLSVNANVSTGAMLFTNLSEQNNFTVNVGLGADYQVTDRTSLGLGQSYSQDFSYNTTLLTNQGIVLPLVLTRAVSSTASLSHQINEKTSVAGNVQFNRIFFDDDAFIDDPTFFAGTPFIGGSTFSVGASVARQLTPRSSINANYRVQRSVGEGVEVFITQGVSGGWGHTLSPRVSLGLNAGVDRSSGQGFTGSFYSLNGGAFLSATTGRGAVSLNYNRSVNQTFGFGQVSVSDAGMLNFTHPLSERANFTTSATYTVSRDLNDTFPPFHFVNSSVGLSFRVTNAFNVGMNYSFQYFYDPTTNRDLTSNAGSISLSYGWSWQ